MRKQINFYNELIKELELYRELSSFFRKEAEEYRDENKQLKQELKLLETPKQPRPLNLKVISINRKKAVDSLPDYNL